MHMYKFTTASSIVFFIAIKICSNAAVVAKARPNLDIYRRMTKYCILLIILMSTILSNQAEAIDCVKWRQTGNCKPDGPREPYNDKSCDSSLANRWSGYCECAGGLTFYEKSCGDNVYSTCHEACSHGKEDGINRFLSCRSRKVSLKSYNEKYVVAESDGRLSADRNLRGPEAIFEVEILGGEKIALKSAYGKYLAADEKYDVNANISRHSRELWTGFSLEGHQARGGKVALKTVHGMYVGAKEDGSLMADRTESGPLERFLPECMIGSQYLATDPNGLCSDFNKPIVNDVDSCRKAVSTINKDAPNTLWAGTVTTQFLPKGCQLCMDGAPGCWASSRHENPLYFNNHTDGVRRRGVSQICLESIEQQRRSFRNMVQWNREHRTETWNREQPGNSEKIRSILRRLSLTKSSDTPSKWRPTTKQSSQTGVATRPAVARIPSQMKTANATCDKACQHIAIKVLRGRRWNRN